MFYEIILPSADLSSPAALIVVGIVVVVVNRANRKHIARQARRRSRMSQYSHPQGEDAGYVMRAAHVPVALEDIPEHVDDTPTPCRPSVRRASSRTAVDRADSLRRTMSHLPPERRETLTAETRPRSSALDGVVHVQGCKHDVLIGVQTWCRRPRLMPSTSRRRTCWPQRPTWSAVITSLRYHH